MKRLEERVACQDDAGQDYVVEVHREVVRAEDGTQIIGRREAFLSGDPAFPLKVFDDEGIFQTRAGQILRRVE